MLQIGFIACNEDQLSNIARAGRGHELILAAALAAFAFPADAPIVVIALGDPVAAKPTIAKIEKSYKRRGAVVLDSQGALMRLTGLDAPHRPNADSLGKMLEDAYDLFARFQSPAELLDQVYAAYWSDPYPDAETRSYAAWSIQLRAAAAWTENRGEQAKRQAALYLAEFPDVPVDERRINPSLQHKFHDVYVGLGPAPRSTPTVIVDRPATIFVDGLPAAKKVTNAKLDVPAGKHRIWAAGEDGSRSLPKLVQLDQTESTLHFSIDLDQRLTFEPLGLRCIADCMSDLRRLAARMGAQVIAVEQTAGGPKIATLDPENPAASTDFRYMDRPQFSWLNFFPLGIAQAYQNRVGYALTYAGIQLAAWGFFTYATVQHQNSVTSADWAHEPGLRRRQNTALSVALVFTGASVVEALSVAWLTGTPYADQQ